MATIYVSYKRHEKGFVSEVVAHLEAEHEVYIDYKMPAGVDWRNHMLDKLRTSEVFVVFASRDTAKSDYQNAEIGSARFCSTFVDQKLIVPVVIDQVPIPRTMQDLDCLLQTERDIERTAQAILDAIERRTRRIRLFVSHSRKDEDLASKLVDVITSGLEVPPGAIRCTSVPGYQLALGTMAPEALRRELGSAACVIAILTPNSVVAEWVLFELGAAWANAKVAIPLLVGGIADSDIPGPFRGAAGGELKNPITLRHLINQLEHNLSWRQNNGLQADAKLYALAQYAAEKENESTDDETRASFGAKLARIGTEQLAIINHVTYKRENRPYISQRELEDKFSSMPTHIFFRLEQLRLLGFLQRTKIGEINGEPTYGWTLSERYQKHIRR